MLVQDVMNSHLITVEQDETVAAAARLLSRHNVGALPVIGPGGRLKGMLTDRDIAIRCVAANFDPNLTRVRSVMSTGAVTIPAGADSVEAARTMAKAGVRRLPVTENGKLVGMLSQGDFANCPPSPETARAFQAVFQPLTER